MNRRNFMKLSLSGLALAIVSPTLKWGQASANNLINKIILSKQEWREKLTPEQYYILREEGTERPFTSELLYEKRNGIFACAGCDLPLFMSSHKYDSKTGWPSFYEHIKDHIETKTDYKLLYPRTEYHCARCGGHHGHVFDDGPEPTGLRYCNNGVALKFIVKEI
jgi:peptide-methionine (R)-S-oxide reductase